MTSTPESRLLQLYDRIGEAPDAIPRLRRFVLDLAVRGKLVEQNPEDEPAEALLERIAAEKARLLKAGKIRKKWAHEREMIKPPFELPDNWTWAPLGRIFLYDAGEKLPPKALEPAVWLLELEDIEKDTGRLLRRLAVADRQSKSTKSEFQLGDILYGKLRPYLTKVLVADQPGYSTTEIVAIRPFLRLCSEYCALAFRRPDFVDYVTRLGQGTKMPRLRTEDAVVAPFPLPPLPEQHRIVAKVDELMTLLDRLETTRSQREANRDRLTTASLARLTAPKTTEKEFRAHAGFALDNLDQLTGRPEQIKLLRQTILNLAVRGKLVEQNPADEPAAELLKRIAVKRSALLDGDYPNPAEAKTQKKKQASQKVPTDLPELPPGWAWSTLQQCSLMVIDCKNKTAPYSSDGIKLIRTTNVRDGKLNSNDQKFVSKETYEAWSLRAKPEPGDVLITREAPMGEVCSIPEGERVCLGQRMMLARLAPGTIDPSFMLYSLRDPALMERVQNKPLGMTVQHLRVGGVETLLVPLPPLAEQHRIVAKADGLMALCNRLEAALSTANTNRARLLKSLLYDALNVSVSDKEAA